MRAFNYTLLRLLVFTSIIIILIVPFALATRSIEVCTASKERTYPIFARHKIEFSSVSGLGGSRCKLTVPRLLKSVADELKNDALLHRYVLEIRRQRYCSLFDTIDRVP